MAIDFPNSPTNGQRFTVGDKTWVYDGTSWNSDSAFYTHASTHSKAGSDPLTLDVAAPALATSGTQSSFKFDGDTYLNWSSDSTGAHWLIFDKSRGTLASKTSVVSNDELGRISFYGYSSDGTSHEAAWISSRAVETPTDVGSSNEIPSTIRFGIFDSQGVAWEPLTLTRSTNYPLTNTFGIVRMDSYSNSGYVDYAISGQFTIKTTTESDNLVLTRYSTAGAPTFTMRRSYTSTIDTSGTVIAGNALGNFYFSGWNSSLYNDGAGIRGYAEENWTSTAEGSNLRFYTTPIGGTTLTERMRIAADGLITGTGTSLGTWTSYTPTFSGTGWSLGNALTYCAYSQIGKTVFVRIRIDMGSTTTFGTGRLDISTPVTAKSTGYYMSALSFYNDQSAAQSFAGTVVVNGNIFELYNNASTSRSDVTSTVPFTWAQSDVIYLTAVYEAN